MAELVGGDGVPLAVAEALPLGNVLRCDPSSSVVDVEEQLAGAEGICERITDLSLQRFFVTVLTLKGKFGSSDVGLYEVLIFSKCITVIR